jgi:hypothetical protein
LIEEIIPIGVHRFDPSELLLARAALQLLFPSDRSIHHICKLETDEEFTAVSLGEAVAETFAMLPYTFDQVGRDARVQRAIPSLAMM